MTYMSSIDRPLRIAGTTPALRRRPAPIRRGFWLLRLLHAAMEWQRRAEERQQVLEMDMRLLRDIGASREELLRAIDRRD
jgi:uncharacterized protein YjiS (DUF1127 family)